jgi:hypothetical protein
MMNINDFTNMLKMSDRQSVWGVNSTDLPVPSFNQPIACDKDAPFEVITAPEIPLVKC